MIKAYIKFWKNYIDFSGKSKRADYWWVFLINTVIQVIYYVVSEIETFQLIGNKLGENLSTNQLANIVKNNPNLHTLKIIFIIYGLIILIPTSALVTRRLRDAGMLWWLGVISGLLSLLSIILSLAEIAGLVSYILLAVSIVFGLIVNIILCAKESADDD